MAKIAGIREAPKQVAVEKDSPPFCFPTKISPTFSSGLQRVLNQKQTNWICDDEDRNDAQKRAGNARTEN